MVESAGSSVSPSERHATVFTESLSGFAFSIVKSSLGQPKTEIAASNENKMSDRGRGRASLGVKVWKSSQKWPYGGPPFAPSHG